MCSVSFVFGAPWCVGGAGRGGTDNPAAPSILTSESSRGVSPVSSQCAHVLPCVFTDRFVGCRGLDSDLIQYSSVTCQSHPITCNHLPIAFRSPRVLFKANTHTDAA